MSGSPDDRDEPPAPGAPPRPEPRVKDLLTRPRAEVEGGLDPATLAELESWFARPSVEAVEASAAAEADADADAETRAYEDALARRDRACAAADPAFVDHLERHRRARPPAQPVFEPRPVIDERIVLPVVRAELERQAGDEAGLELEYQVPTDVSQILEKHNAPQAILRDLFRPEEEYERRLESPFGELPELDPLRESREAMRTRQVIEWIEPVLPSVQAARAAGREILDQPWDSYWELFQEIHADRERRRER